MLYEFIRTLCRRQGYILVRSKTMAGPTVDPLGALYINEDGCISANSQRASLPASDALLSATVTIDPLIKALTIYAVTAQGTNLGYFNFGAAATSSTLTIPAQGITI